MKIKLTKDGEARFVWRVDSYWLVALGWEVDGSITYTEREKQAVEDHKAVNAKKKAGETPKTFEQMNVLELKAYAKSKKLEVEYVTGESADEVRVRILEAEKPE